MMCGATLEFSDGADPVVCTRDDPELCAQWKSHFGSAYTWPTHQALLDRGIDPDEHWAVLGKRAVE